MRYLLLHVISIALPLAGIATTHAQQGPRPPGTTGIPGVPQMLQRVDPMRGDVSPLSESLREVNMQTDLRGPTGFQDVYHVPGRDDLLMRASGGIYAVFPQSVYVATDQGVMAQVPPGTIYTIGTPSNWILPPRSIGPVMILERPDRIDATSAMAAAAQQGPAGSAQTISNRVVLRQGNLVNDEWSTGVTPASAFLLTEEGPIALRQAVPATPPEPSEMLRTIVTDEVYRSQRITELLRMATDVCGER